MAGWFERTTATLSDFVLAGLFTLVFGVFAYAAFVTREDLPVDAATADQALESEVALATAAGLRLVEDHRPAEARVRRELTLAPGECFSVVAAAAGRQGVPRFTVRDAAGTDLGDEVVLHPSLFVRHLQWCSPPGGRFTVDVEAPVAPRLALLKGTPTGPLPRVAPRRDLLPRLRGEAAVAALAHDPRIALSPVVTLADPRQVLLLPSTPATRAALADAVMPPAGESAPALAPGPAALRVLDAPDAAPVVRGRRDRVAPPPPPPAAGTPTRPLFRLLGDDLRVVAVVDRGALHASCVTLRFACGDAASPTLWRSDVPGWTTAPLPVRDGVATDATCPAQGLAVYAARRDATCDGVLLSVQSGPGRAGASPTASAWHGESTPHSLLARLDRACATDADACMDLARLALRPLPEAMRPDLAASLQRACDLADADACGRLGVLLLERRRDTAGAAAALARGCDGSDATACAILGEHERRGDQGIPQDLAGAVTHLEAACRLGVAGACADRNAMRLLGLGGG